ncbi:MAG: DUF2934 domain-containing protein [Thermodesulfovibrionales bacterium]
MNIYDEISRVAYEIWVKKGMPEGNDLENWLEAEQIVYSSLREKGESGFEVKEYAFSTVVSPITETEASPVSEVVNTVSSDGKPKTQKKTTKSKQTTASKASKSTSKKTPTKKKA